MDKEAEFKERKKDIEKGIDLLVPDHIKSGVRRYIFEGCPVGDFLTAVITNNLEESFMRADGINLARMGDIVRFFYQYAPMGSRCSSENMELWMEAGGLRGIYEVKDV